MKLLEKYHYLHHALSCAQTIFKKQHSHKFMNDRYLGEILRNTHSIEKGLSLSHVRLGFGEKKINETYEIIKKYKNNKGDMKATPLIMFIDALHAYLNYHKQQDFSSPVIKRVDEIYMSLSSEIQTMNHSFGGTLSIKTKHYSESERITLSQLFENRHSIRDFKGTPINMDDFRKAVDLATRCPSACNRQCYRLHVVDKADFSMFENWFDGIGGFAHELDKMLFITGNISMYRANEQHQWIVTSSIFAAYLSLTLEIYGIGSCFVQRPVLPSKRWETIASKIGASGDEQLVCCMGIGNMKEEYNVPVSHRLNNNIIMNVVNTNL